jgi:hypothetical protein
VHEHRKTPNNLDRELKKATDTFELVLKEIMLMQGEAVKEAVCQGTQEVKGAVREAVHQGTQEVRRDLLHPQQDDGPRPNQLECPRVFLEDNLMKISWTDNRNLKDKVTRYEVLYDEQNDIILPFAVDECRLIKNLVLKLGEPKDYILRSSPLYQ